MSVRKPGKGDEMSGTTSSDERPGLIRYGCPCGAIWDTAEGGACSPRCPRPKVFAVRCCTVCRGPLGDDDEGPECDSYGCPARYEHEGAVA